MKAFIVDRYGKNDVGRIGDMELEMRHDDVLVQIHAAGVNLLDPKSETENSNSFCLIVYRSFWATMWRQS